MNTKEEVLSACTIEGEIVKLPKVQLERKLYQEVAKSLELIGGKWKGGKTMGFIFPQNPTELLAAITGGEKRNLKKEFQFFETPEAIADTMAENLSVKEGMTVLEPSAGQGALIRAVWKLRPNHLVYACELMDINRIFLSKMTNVSVVGTDFLEFYHPFNFDRIIANPPFAKNQDITHIMKMWDCLKPGGRIVTLSSTHWKLSKNKKETEFRAFLDKYAVTIEDIEAGAFAESGTKIPTCLIILQKPEL